MFQGGPFQILHGDEGLPLLLAYVIDRADVGMVQSGSRLGLTLEAAEGLRVFGHFIGQKLQRHETPQPGVLRLVDDTHAAAPEFLNNAVMRDDLVDHLRGCLGFGSLHIKDAASASQRITALAPPREAQKTFLVRGISERPPRATFRFWAAWDDYRIVSYSSLIRLCQSAS